MVDNTINQGFANQAYLNETRSGSVRTPGATAKPEADVNPAPKTGDVVQISNASEKIRQAEETARSEESNQLVENENIARQERIQTLQAKVESGNYNVSAENVADKIVGTILEDFV